VHGFHETVFVFLKCFLDRSCCHWGLRGRRQNRWCLHLRFLLFLFFLIKQILLLRRSRWGRLNYWLFILFVILIGRFILLHRGHRWRWKNRRSLLDNWWGR